MNPRKLWHALQLHLPVSGFRFDRPLLLLQSDDWGRAGVRDQEGVEALRSAGLVLGERPYDLYTLETADDVHAMRELLAAHRDCVGRSAVIGMNFIVSNLDFPRMKITEFNRIHQLQLAEGLPSGWFRPGLGDAYHEGIAQRVFAPALHGTTHFCQQAVERYITNQGERGQLLRTLWEAGTPYIHWRMPWIGYEYWDPEQPASTRFLPPQTQHELIGTAVGAFVKMFSTLPRSACAPGYRDDRATHKAWAHHGIRVAQGGPGSPAPPHFDSEGLLQLARTIEFEPATAPDFSVDAAISTADRCFALGLPAIVSVHSINFHSSLRDFRTRTLSALDQFLNAIRSRHPDLLFADDADLYQLVQHGSFDSPSGKTVVKVTQTRFSRGALRQLSAAGNGA